MKAINLRHSVMMQDKNIFFINLLKQCDQDLEESRKGSGINDEEIERIKNEVFSFLPQEIDQSSLESIFCSPIIATTHIYPTEVIDTLLQLGLITINHTVGVIENNPSLYRIVSEWMQIKEPQRYFRNIKFEEVIIKERMYKCLRDDPKSCNIFAYYFQHLMFNTCLENREAIEPETLFTTLMGFLPLEEKNSGTVFVILDALRRHLYNNTHYTKEYLTQSLITIRKVLLMIDRFTFYKKVKQPKRMHIPNTLVQMNTA